MDEASSRAREGDVKYFSDLPSDHLSRLVKRFDEDGRSLLHTAAAAGSLDLTTLLAEAGGKDLINTADDEGWTPLHSSVSGGHEAVVKDLLQLGADVNATTTSGLAPLHHAASKGRTSIVKLLLEHGADSAVQDKTGASPLHRAAATGKVESMRALLAAGGNGLMRVRDKTGATPLFVAASVGQAEAAVLLVAEGADLEAETRDKETPLSVAGPLKAAMLQASQDRTVG